MRRALRSVAVLEGTKGVLAMASLIGLLSLLHHDLHHLAMAWMGYWGLDPTRPYPELLLHSVDALKQWSPNTLTLFALGYAAVRFAEAYGLWWGSPGANGWVPCPVVCMCPSKCATSCTGRSGWAC